ncbi:rCG61645, partial [Rattus norvegicus]
MEQWPGVHMTSCQKQDERAGPYWSSLSVELNSKRRPRLAYEAAQTPTPCQEDTCMDRQEEMPAHQAALWDPKRQLLRARPTNFQVILYPCFPCHQRSSEISDLSHHI